MMWKERHTTERSTEPSHTCSCRTGLPVTGLVLPISPPRGDAVVELKVLAVDAEFGGGLRGGPENA
jgi:hypothetical protein